MCYPTRKYTLLCSVYICGKKKLLSWLRIDRNKIFHLQSYLFSGMGRMFHRLAYGWVFQGFFLSSVLVLCTLPAVRWCHMVFIWWYNSGPAPCWTKSRRGWLAQWTIGLFQEAIPASGWLATTWKWLWTMEMYPTKSKIYFQFNLPLITGWGKKKAYSCSCGK